MTINTERAWHELERYRNHKRSVDKLRDEAGLALAQQVYGPVGFHSLRHVARETGLSPTYLSRVLSGDVRISVDAYCQIAEWFFAGSGRSLAEKNNAERERHGNQTPVVARDTG